MGEGEGVRGKVGGVRLRKEGGDVAEVRGVG